MLAAIIVRGWVDITTVIYHVLFSFPNSKEIHIFGPSQSIFVLQMCADCPVDDMI